MAESGTQQLDIVFTAPHPDDLEITCGGTIAKMVKLGHRVGMVHMTNGEPTPLGDTETRLREMREAAEILGVQVCEMINLPNRVLMDGPEARFALATVLRKYKPRVLVGVAGRTVAASPDHYQAQLITEATRFYSQLSKWNERFGNTEPHAIDHLVYRPLVRMAEAMHFPAQFVMDITETIDQKIAAVACYRSQFPAERFERLRHYMLSLAGYEGGMCGYNYGELFALPRPIGVRDPMQIFEIWPVPSPIEVPKI